MHQARAVTSEAQRLQAGLARARARTDELFQLVRPEARYDRPIPERHRIIFYLGHLEAFDWNLVCLRGFGMKSFHPEYDKLFAFGIDPVDGGLPTDQPSDWPKEEEILQYNRRVQKGVDDCLRAFAAQGPGKADPKTTQMFHVIVEHREMHAETLSYMLHQLPIDRKTRPERSQRVPRKSPAPPSPAAVTPKIVKIPAGRVTLGLPRGNGEFGWDNEFDEHTVEVPEFAIDVRNVTNAQFLEFLRAGGYEHRNLWTDADWEWKEKAGICQPVFWRRHGEEWLLRTMFDEVPLPPDWPVYVSHAEASAYARWTGKALPTEGQFHRAAYGTPQAEERSYPWGDAEPNPRLGNFDFASWDPAPVGAYPAGCSAFGVDDLVGNGWEWTSTVFEPFDGFERFPFYPGYSANFFDGKHYVIKGGSMRTAGGLLRRSFRNWFQSHYQYMYAGFRCVE